MQSQRMQSKRMRRGVRRAPATASPAACTKFAQLPREILAMIFEFAFAQGGLPFVRSVCLTCREWYALATTIPELWTILRVDSEACSVERLRLWNERSRSKPLSIRLYPKVTTTSLPQPFDPDYATEMAKTILGSFHRWRFAMIEVVVSDDDAKRIWTETVSRGANILEEITMKWSGEMGNISDASSFPRLRKLHVERAASRWAPVILRNTITTLTSLTINNVDLPHRLFLSTFLRCLKATERLEELRMDEVTFSDPTAADPESDETDLSFTLLHLHTLSLTAVSHTEQLTRYVNFPEVTTLVLGATSQQYISPTFLHLSRSTHNLESFSTGLWHDSVCGFAELALISLLWKQQRLKRLAVRDAAVGDELAMRLVLAPPYPFGVGTRPFLPTLANLELPIARMSPRALIQVAKSRGRGLRYLTLVGSRIDIGLVDDLSRYVGEVDIDERSDFETMSSITD